MEDIKEIIINHKGTRMVKDGEDWHGLQITHFKNLGRETFQDAHVVMLFLELTKKKGKNETVKILQKLFKSKCCAQFSP